MKKTVVTPGETLAYVEEFEVKGSAYSVDYRYLSSVLGVAAFDEKTHIAVVRPLKDPAIPPPRLCGVLPSDRKGEEGLPA